MIARLLQLDKPELCSFVAVKELDGGGCFTFDKFGVGGKAHGFHHVGLHLLAESIDLVDSEASVADGIPQLLLSRGSLDNPQNRVRDFLSIAGTGGKHRAELRRDLLSSAIRSRAGLVGSRHRIAENGSLIGAR